MYAVGSTRNIGPELLASIAASGDRVNFIDFIDTTQHALTGESRFAEQFDAPQLDHKVWQWCMLQ